MNELKCTQGVIYAIKNAQVVSRKYKLNYVGTEEILYGLLCLPKYNSCMTLNAYGVNKDNFFSFLKETFRYNDETGGFTPLDRTLLSAMRHIVYSEFSRLYSFTIPNDSANRLSEITGKYITVQTDHRFAALDFYNSVAGK